MNTPQKAKQIQFETVTKENFKFLGLYPGPKWDKEYPNQRDDFPLIHYVMCEEIEHTIAILKHGCSSLSFVGIWDKYTFPDGSLYFDFNQYIIKFNSDAVGGPVSVREAKIPVKSLPSVWDEESIYVSLKAIYEATKLMPFTFV